MVRGRAPAWCVRLHVAEDGLAALEAAVSELGGAVAYDPPDAAGRVRVEVYVAEVPERAAVAALLRAALPPGSEARDFRIERLPDRDWVAESRAALPGIEIGGFWIHGAHVHAPPPAGAIPLEVEASVAFGTGRHESTRGCLLALRDLAAGRAVARALDMGCGSGILSLAMAKLWGCAVVAVDNDADAVAKTRENAALNGVGALVDVHLGEGYGDPAVGRRGPYDVIAANILAGPLGVMAPELIRHLAPGGVGVLSGLLSEQAEGVLNRHRPLRPLRRYSLGEWVTLVVG